LIAQEGGKLAALNAGEHPFLPLQLRCLNLETADECLLLVLLPVFEAVAIGAVALPLSCTAVAVAQLESDLSLGRDAHAHAVAVGVFFNDRPCLAVLCLEPCVCERHSAVPLCHTHGVCT
jgi:hypothetical protein